MIPVNQYPLILWIKTQKMILKLQIRRKKIRFVHLSLLNEYKSIRKRLSQNDAALELKTEVAS
jgi:hypothetical protein